MIGRRGRHPDPVEAREGPLFAFCQAKFVPLIACDADVRFAFVGASLRPARASPAPECPHSTVRIFPDNVLPCPVVHQQNTRTTHRMNQPPLRTAHFLFDTNENPLNYLTPSKHREVAISIRYKFGSFARSPFRNAFARRTASRHPSLKAIAQPAAAHPTSHHSSVVAYHCTSPCISNRQMPELERNVTYRKQKTALRSNRQKMHGWKNPFSACHRPAQSANHKSPITSHGSLITAHQSFFTNPSHDHSP